jgi:hypothetical protein
MQQVNRFAPALPSHAYNTYSISAPRDVLVKTACEQAGCVAWLKGWQSPIDESTDLGKAQSAYIRTQSGRTFREQRSAVGITVFTFEPKQRCFTDHRTRPERFAVAHGDYRHSTLTRVHANGADWVEDFALHQQKLADRLNQG